MWWWVLIWVVLVLGALGLFARIGLSLWRSAKLLFAELSTASDRFAEISAKLEEAAERVNASEPAVFADPSQLRRERYLAQQRNTGRRSGKPAVRPTPGSAGQGRYRVR